MRNAQNTHASRSVGTLALHSPNAATTGKFKKKCVPLSSTRARDWSRMLRRKFLSIHGCFSLFRDKFFQSCNALRTAYCHAHFSSFLLFLILSSSGHVSSVHLPQHQHGLLSHGIAAWKVIWRRQTWRGTNNTEQEIKLAILRQTSRHAS
jgi:hypothetical protein